MGRIARSWQLTKCSFIVLGKDKELMILPVLSGLVLLIVIASFVIPLGLLGVEGLEGTDDGLLITVGLLFYIVAYTISFFFQAAVVAGATERMRGADPTLGSALGAARERFGRILIWGVIAGTVGFVIKSIQERSEFAGKIVMGLIGASWSLATFFMLPVLVLEDHDIKPSFRRSWDLFKQTWGETVVGSGGIGIASVLMILAVCLVGGMFASLGLVAFGVIVAVLGVLVVAVITSALQGINVAALYRFATTGEVPSGFGDSGMEAAFAPKR